MFRLFFLGGGVLSRVFLLPTLKWTVAFQLNIFYQDFLRNDFSAPLPAFKKSAALLLTTKGSKRALFPCSLRIIESEYPLPF